MSIQINFLSPKSGETSASFETFDDLTRSPNFVGSRNLKRTRSSKAPIRPKRVSKAAMDGRTALSLGAAQAAEDDDSCFNTSPKKKWRCEDKFNLAENATYTKIIVARLISSKSLIPPPKDKLCVLE